MSLCFHACKVVDTESAFDKSVFAGDENLVSDMAEFNKRASVAVAGDEIVLAKGIWKDAELVIKGKGTADNPIILKVEEKGMVFMEGQSNLKISGSHIHVEGLVFRNGHTTSGSVISFRSSKQDLCNNCRVTECVVDDYNPVERFDSDYWVEIYGKNNRFDHCYLVGKRNKGVTVAVRLKTEASRENNHRIDHNFFGYHPVLGSNGGETLRIGTSHHSLSNSNTMVEDNYFESCNGELEVISNKSCQNVFRNNTFHECKGTLTMRHGNEILVDNNYFFGNRIVNTGGIRIINETQTVTNNYLEGLTGYRFRSAIVVMNGVPDSPINRYFQVIDSKTSNNLMIDCDHIQLCAGSDEERSASPKNCEMNNNIIYNTQKDDLFTIYDDISGISFSDNILSPNVNIPEHKEKAVEGFTHEKLSFRNDQGIKRCVEYPGIGPESDKPRPTESNTGVSWYPIKNYQIQFGTGKVIEVEPGDNTVYEAVRQSREGDIIRLIGSGEYNQTQTISIPHTLSVTARAGAEPVLTYETSTLFSLENGGSLAMEGIKVSGAECDDYSGNSVVRTSRFSMINNYKLMMRNCEFVDLDVNHSFNVVRVYKSTFADSILLSNCNFDNISGDVLRMDKEIDDVGIYNVENVVVEHCTFKDIGGVAVKLYRGGRDESTNGPILEMNNSTFTNVGKDKRNKNNAAVALYGVQYADMNNLKFDNCRNLDLHLIVGEPVITVSDSEFTNCKLVSNDEAYVRKNLKFNNSN